MTLLACATHVVADLDAAVARYTAWFDYQVVAQGPLDAELAAAWGAPDSAGRASAVLQPASGADTFLRLVEGDRVPGYEPLRTYGWAATEICVQDVGVVHARMTQSPFMVIGQPKPLDGFEMVIPMQVEGPDQEIVYLTEIPEDGSALGLPVPRGFIDRPFIMVLASADIAATVVWAREVLGLVVSDPVAIRYTMLIRSFALPDEAKTLIATAGQPGDTVLEFDQYPAAATVRPCHPGALPPGVAVVTIRHPDIAQLAGHWASPPVRRDGAPYGGRLCGVLRSPDGALLEVIDGA